MILIRIILLNAGSADVSSAAYETCKSFFALCAQCGRDVRAPSYALLLTTHSLLENVLQLKRVRHSQQRRRTQPERPTVRVRCKLDPAAKRIRIGQRQLHFRCLVGDSLRLTVGI